MLRKWLKRLRRTDAATAAAVQDAALTERVIAELRTIHDPEIPLNIHDLGLIYDISATTAGVVRIKMTLTTPNCPVAQTFPRRVESRLMTVDGVTRAHVELVWDPPWSPDRLSDAARLQLGLY